jgi:putative ABC transport system permease protein
MSIWSLAVRNLLRNRRRSLLTGGVVVFGYAAFALAGGFMAQSLEGLREGTIRSGMGHLHIARPEAFRSGAETTLEYGLTQFEAIETLLRRDAEVVEVLPRIDFFGLVTNGTRTVPFLGIGLDPQREARVMDTPRTISSGRWLSSREERGVVLGRGLAAALGLGVDDGVTLLATTEDGTLNAVDAHVTGLADIPIKEMNERFLATSLSLASDLLAASGKVSKLVLVLRDGADAPRSLSRLVDDLHGREFDVAGKTWEELATFYQQVRILYMGIFGFMGAVLVAVVLLACANTMMMAATERTREIGTLRALGTRARFIRRQFLAEGMTLAALGCVAGALLSLALRQILNHSGIVLPPPPGATSGMPLHIKIYGLAHAAGALAMLLTLAISSWLPARRASRRRIVDALTHV